MTPADTQMYLHLPVPRSVMFHFSPTLHAAAAQCVHDDVPIIIYKTPTKTVKPPPPATLALATLHAPLKFHPPMPQNPHPKDHTTREARWADGQAHVD
jgi:hypothetical protein